MRDDIEQLIDANGGVIRRRDHPQLAYRLDRARRNGSLVALLPGVLVAPAVAATWQGRVLAGHRWLGPDAVVTRHAAARLTFWPQHTVEEISFAVPGAAPRPQPGWPVVRSAVPPELVWHAGTVPVSCPAYTAVELADQLGGEVIDQALRSRQASIPLMWQALKAMPGRAGNTTRRRLLHDSRDAPWSEFERLGHRVLRRHRVRGWRTNAWVRTTHGGYFVDVLFSKQRVIVEFDGFEFHNSRDAFEQDRRRRNELVLAGYTVLNFTWKQLIDDPDWVITCIRRALAELPAK